MVPSNGSTIYHNHLLDNDVRHEEMECPEGTIVAAESTTSSEDVNRVNSIDKVLPLST